MRQERRQWLTRVVDWLRYKRRRLVAACVAVVVLLAGLGYGGYLASRPPSLSCDAPGVAHPDATSDECVGVTDGRFDFSSRLHGIDGLIKKENDRVGHGPGIATIAVLLPMAGADATIALHAVEGAYVAQYRANHLSSEAPKLRLVLASPGSASRYWRPVAAHLATMTGAPDNLRVVTGISVSTAATKAEVDWLTHHAIPVVSSTTTAEDLANPSGSDARFPGLARIAPTNLDEADALSHVNAIDPRKALLVEDQRPHDNYIASLSKVFTAVTRGAPYQPVQYTSPADVDADGTTENQFVQDTTTICQLGPRFIYFAGRHVQLRQFINQLGRHCPTTAFTVLAGSDASHLSDDTALDRSVFGPHRITLEYAALATPDAWAGPALAHTGAYAAGYRAFAAASAKAFPAGALPAVELSDGEALMGHDAVWTARQAMVLLIGVQQNDAGRLPAAADIAAEWKQLRGRYKVEGASGWICLDNGGNPWNKAVPIVEFDRTGPRFEQLAWPRNRAPDSTCSA